MGRNSVSHRSAVPLANLSAVRKIVAQITQCEHCRPLCPQQVVMRTMRASGPLPERRKMNRHERATLPILMGGLGLHGGGPIAQNFEKASALFSTTHGIRANSHTAGNAGHLPLLTPTSGGSRC